MSLSFPLRRLSLSAGRWQSALRAEGQAPRELWRLDKYNPFQEVPQAWVESLESEELHRVDLIDLHPDIWRVPPRLDTLRVNLEWQHRYRNVVFLKQLSRAELPGSGKKIYPQNAKLGKSRQKSIRSPQWIEGGIAHGVRGPLTDFYMLPQGKRVAGLCVALTCKHVQDDLVIVDSFEDLKAPTSPPINEYGERPAVEKEDNPLWKISEARNWGYSCLFIDLPDIAPVQLARQCSRIPGFTPMPLYGLNVHSLLKHDTLVITRPALERLESRLLSWLHRLGGPSRPYQYKDMKEEILNEAETEQEIFARKKAAEQLREEDPGFEDLPPEEQRERIRTRAREALKIRPPPFV